mmetsp:Transcript_22349/g.19850  ORF Transcript_22349/g.19850 Transcript_22349/m.19850 type:complete len:243 (+) Transcript_22349:54-782(+)
MIALSFAWTHQEEEHGLTITTNVRNIYTDTKFYSKRVHLSKAGQIQDEFTLNKVYRSCQNIPKFEDDLYSTSRKFYFSHTGEAHETNSLKLYATMKPYGVHGGRIPIIVEPDTITLDGKTPVKIRYDCREIPSEYSHAVVELEVSNGESFQYLKQCRPLHKMFWTHFLQFIALAKTAMTVLLVGSKMGKLSLFERIDEYRFDFYKISLKKIIFLITFSSGCLIIFYYLLPYRWFNLWISIGF